MARLLKRAARPFYHSQALIGLSRRGYASAQDTVNGYVVDLRSDVLTRPTRAMKEAMMNATAGDDVFGEDATVNELQYRMADMFGKEAALFVPSGTMGNLISVLCHCQSRGLEVLLGDKSHMILYEQGGIATLGGVHTRAIPDGLDGTYDLDDLDSYIRPKDDPHQPWTALIGVENTHNVCGGKVLPLDFLAELRRQANSYGIPIHMDGARLMNACAYLDIPPEDILRYVDSVSMCFSKGVGAPVGSVMAGTGELIDRAVRLRKVLGGGWRQPGLLAAAAMVAMDGVIGRLKQDHQNAKTLATAMMQQSNGVVNIDVDGIHTNIVMIEVVKKGLTSHMFIDRLQQVTREEELVVGGRVLVKTYPFAPRLLRAVLHSDISSDDVEMTIRKLQFVLSELSESDASVAV